jgi:hypothetical protein
MTIRQDITRLCEKTRTAGDEAAADYLVKALEVLNDDRYDGGKFDFDVTISKNVKPQQICDLLCNAFDGPMTAYWARCESVNMPKEPDWSWCTEKQREDWESVRKIYVASMCGGTIVLVDTEAEAGYDAEHDEGPADHIIEIDREKLRDGLEVMSRDYPRHFKDFINENDDAITADVFVQCVCFGEVVYG